MGTRRERDEKGAPERPLPFIKQPKFNLSPLLRLRSQPRGANLRMGRDRGFRSSLLPRQSSPPPRPSLHPHPRCRRSGSNPAAACGKRLRAWISLPIGREESRPGFQLAVRAVHQKPPTARPRPHLPAPSELDAGLRVPTAQRSPRARGSSYFPEAVGTVRLT